MTRPFPMLEEVGIHFFYEDSRRGVRSVSVATDASEVCVGSPQIPRSSKIPTMIEAVAFWQAQFLFMLKLAMENEPA
jgi:hypothetical protein